MIPSIGRCTLHVSERTPHLVKGLQSCQRWGQSGSRFHQGGLSWALTQELHMTGLQVVDATLDLNLPCSNLRAECDAKLWIQRLWHTWDRRYQMQNASKYIRCKQTAFKRAVLLQLSQPSTSSLYVAICHNMSQYVTICHNMSWYVMICHDVTSVQPAFSLTSGLYCKRKSMVWKTFLAKELMMQEGHGSSKKS